MKNLLLACWTFLFAVSAHSAVILQYHHVSDKTPRSTSISPKQFEKHLKYLADEGFRVIPLSDIVDAIESKEALPDKSIAITFDDAYLDILTNAKPLLDKYNYPFTIFVNPGIVSKGSKSYLSWQQLKEMGEDGVIIANHGYQHDSIARIPDGTSSEAWYKQQTELLLQSEQEIKQNVGQSWRYFAYPYGEYTPETQSWLNGLEFTAFTQQSGAVGVNTDKTLIPRFPASQPYDKLSALKDKLNSLPFEITLNEDASKTLFNYDEARSVTFNINLNDFYKSQLNCYISGLGKEKVKWEGDDQFTITFSKPLPSGRVRANCTAPSIENRGRYYWYSKPWFVLKEDGSWYPL